MTAEERAYEAYPESIIEQEGLEDIPSYDRNSLERAAYQKGYHQAEKDLALTVDDIMFIIGFYNEVFTAKTQWDVEMIKNNPIACWEEVLKRFKSHKEG